MSIIKAAAPKFAGLDLDLIEKAVVSAFLALLAARLVPAALASGSALPVLLLVSEAMVVLFILVRRRTQDISRRGSDWAVGFAGTLLPLSAAAPGGSALAPATLCAALMIAGFCLQLAAKLTLRRSFGVVAANRGVKAQGPYRIVRHPMYAGYALTHIGFLLSGPTAWNVVIYSATLALAVTRILAEERVLGEDPAYRTLQERVRYRLLPFIF